MKYESLTEESIGALVARFYAKIRSDQVLGPIFDRALAERWDAHIATAREFWCSALRVKPGYRGDMLAAHQRVEEIQPSLFPRWLALFQETVAECFAEASANVIYDRATRTARNLETALFHTRGGEGARISASLILEQRAGKIDPSS